MRILFAVLSASLGGHTRTAVTTARALARRGHSVLFLTAADADSRVIEKAALEYRRLPTGWSGVHSVEQHLPGVLREVGADVVHSFDHRVPDVASIVRVCKRMGVPFFYTRCGGPTPNAMISVRPIISLSQELKDGLLRITSLDDDDIKVIPARIDLGTAPDESNALLWRRFKEKYRIPQDASVILRVARLSPDYEDGILLSADAAAALYASGLNVRFVHIGFSCLNLVQRRVQRHFARINQRCGAPVAVSAQDEALDGPAYTGMADVVIGTGRTAFEGMLSAKPTVVVGVKGYAGLVCEEQIDRIAYYNFSGRNVPDPEGSDRGLRQLCATLERLLSDREYRETVAEFGRQYVSQRLNVDLAAAAYEELYASFRPEFYPSDEEIERYLPGFLEVLRERFLPRRTRDTLRLAFGTLGRRVAASEHASRGGSASSDGGGSTATSPTSSDPPTHPK